MVTFVLIKAQSKFEEASVYSYGNSIKVEGVEENVAVQVYNLIGKTVFEKRLSEGEQTMPMRNLPAGYYFVKLTQGQNIKTTKVYLTEGH